MTRLEPLIVGSGGAGRALRLALAMYPEEVAPPRQLERGEALPDADPERSLLVIANPHGLHATYLLEAAARGYRRAICEKPAAVNLEQLSRLEGLALDVWICHGYRLLWGPEQLREAWRQGEFGEVMTIEGRYWQASAARASTGASTKKSWKDDPALGGGHDVLLDLATHWVDLMIYLGGEAPSRAEVRRWYVNAASEHRDTHVHVRLEHGGTSSFGSISKTVHGAGNALEVHILGEKASAGWTLADPDVIVWGRGDMRTIRPRRESRPPARLAPFHAMGWLEGYANLVGDLVGHVCHGRERRGPSLEEQIVVLRTLLSAVAGN